MQDRIIASASALYNIYHSHSLRLSLRVNRAYQYPVHSGVIHCRDKLYLLIFDSLDAAARKTGYSAAVIGRKRHESWAFGNP